MWICWLHVAQQIQNPHGRRNEFDLTVDDVFDFYVAFAFEQAFGQIDDMDDAQNVVKRIAVNRYAGVPGGLPSVRQVREPFRLYERR